MKKLSLVLAFLVVASFGLAQDKVFDRADPAAEPQYGGQMIVNALSDPRSFNPFVTRETSSTDITNRIFPWMTFSVSPMGLVREGELRPEGYLAESWEVQDGGRTVIFTLRQGAQWSDGNPITADDVIFSATVHADPEVNSNAYSGFYIDGSPIVYTKIDDYTVRVDFPQVYAPALSQGFEIVPRHIFEQAYQEGRVTELWGIDTPPAQIISGGPFLLEEFTPGERVVLARNPNFWGVDEEGRQLPYLDRYVFNVVGDTATQLARFLAGEGDVHSATNADQVSQIIGRIDQGLLDAEIFPNVDVTMGTEFIVFNWNHRDPFKAQLFRNVLFRQAMAHLMDKEAMIELALGGLGQPMWSPVSIPVQQWFTEDVARFDYDPDRALELLAQLGFQPGADGVLVNAQGQRLEFNLTTNQGNLIRENIAQIFSEDANAVGVRVNFQPVDFNELVRQLTAPDDAGYRDFDGILIGLTGGVEPPIGRNVFELDGSLHAWNFGPDFEAFEILLDRLSRRGVQTLDPAERRAIYVEFQQVMAENLPLIYTVASAYNPARLNRLGGLFGGEELSSIVGQYPYAISPINVYIRP